MKIMRAYNVKVDYGRKGIVDTMIVADSVATAEFKIQKRGGSIIEIQRDTMKTIDFFLSHGQFPPRELAQVYTNIGRRLSKGARTSSAIEQAEAFVTSSVLKTALQDVRAAVSADMNIAEAMLDAGFPDEDCSLVDAMRGIGEVGRAFLSLGDSWGRTASLRKKVKSMLFQPKIYSVIGALSIWASFFYVIPIMSKKFSSLGMTLPGMVHEIYALDGVIYQHRLIYSVVYFGLLFGLGYILYAAPFMKKLYNKAPYLSEILSRSDASQSLSTLSMLYAAASMTRPKIMYRVSSACQNEEMKMAFSQFGDLMDTGVSQREAVLHAGFPKFIAPTMVGAFSADDPADTVDELRNAAEMLAEDVDAYSKKFQDLIGLLFMVMMGIMIFMVFLVTLYPTVATSLNNV